MTDQTGVALLVIRADVVFAQITQDDLQDVFVDLRLDEAVGIRHDGVGAPGVKSGDNAAVLIQPDGILSLVAVTPRMFHAVDGLHFCLDAVKASDAFQAVCHLIPLKFFLLLVGKLLDLAAAALPCHRAGRSHPVR